jgi:hypothetical protein
MGNKLEHFPHPNPFEMTMIAAASAVDKNANLTGWHEF